MESAASAKNWQARPNQIAARWMPARDRGASSRAESSKETTSRRTLQIQVAPWKSQENRNDTNSRPRARASTQAPEEGLPGTAGKCQRNAARRSSLFGWQLVLS